MDNNLKDQLLDDLISGGVAISKTTVENGRVKIERVDPIEYELKDFPCLFELSKDGNCVGSVHDQCPNCETRREINRNSTFDQAVARYLDHPKDETFEQRKARINRFRCGY